MKTNQDHPRRRPPNGSAGELRRRAEERLQTQEQTPQSAIRNPQSPVPNPQSAQRLAYELQVHQIELEMQNEELRAAQAKLEAALAQYTELYDFSPAGYFTLARDSTIRQANVTGASLLGIERSGLLNRRFAGFVAAEARSAFGALLARAFETEASQSGKASLSVKGKPPLTVHLQVNVTEDDQECRVVMTDLTERTRADEAFQLSQQRLSLHVEQTPLAVIDFDLEGRVRGWNPGAVAVFGYSREEAIGQHWSFIVPAAIHGQVEAVWAAIVGQRGGSRSNNENLTKDGRTISCEWFNTPLIHRDGRTIGVASLIHDVTGRKREEETLRTFNAELEQRVRERTAQLAAANQQLEDANKELEAFSYSVSHDLRAPLRHVHGFVEMLAQEAGGQLSEKGQRCLKIIADASEEMGVLIDDLLAFSRMARAEMRETSVELGAMVQEALRGLESATQGRNIVWKIPPLPVVQGDPAMLKQVFANLLDNAVKYTRPRDPAQIELGCAGEEDGRIILFVRDNGVGFDPQYAHKLFGVFQRLHRADQFEGTGVGLANVQRIIARHGGRAWAEGKVNEGATFYFTLKPSLIPVKGKEPIL